MTVDSKEKGTKGVQRKGMIAPLIVLVIGIVLSIVAFLILSNSIERRPGYPHCTEMATFFFIYLPLRGVGDACIFISALIAMRRKASSRFQKGALFIVILSILTLVDVFLFGDEWAVILLGPRILFTLIVWAIFVVLSGVWQTAKELLR